MCLGFIQRGWDTSPSGVVLPAAAIPMKIVTDDRYVSRSAAIPCFGV